MSYTKTTWASGDTITSAKLNKIEQGIYDASGTGESSIFVVNNVDDTLDKTALEIQSAITSGKIVEILAEVSNGNYAVDYVTGFTSPDNDAGGTITTVYGDYNEFKSVYVFSSLNDYPEYTKVKM